jgi:hypothetical protein
MRHEAIKLRALCGQLCVKELVLCFFDSESVGARCSLLLQLIHY